MNYKARFGFYLAGIYNLIGILGFTLFFTDNTLSVTDPVVFSWVGECGIILWGLAYLAVSRNFTQVPYLVGVFFIEKVLYAVAWFTWLLNNQETVANLNNVVMQAFFSSYGFGDFCFAIFFGFVFFKLMRGGYKA
ncbi:MAG: hypothetical protein HUJ84_00355 [Veillonella sp.]|nr:hypothetical protein [Veillonella sp.]